MILIAFPEMERLARDIARHLDADVGVLDWHRFPDGESLVTLPVRPSGEEVALVASLRDPDRLALPLRFAAATARDLGAPRVGLVAPYLGYMRQDSRFHPTQAVSAPMFARFLGESFDWMVTVDPHLHRIARLEDIFPMPAAHVSTAPLLADWIARTIPDACLLGPDSESRQWVGEVGRLARRPFEVLRKHRRGDRSVEVSIPENAMLRQGTPVILDDIASSGRTMIRAVERLVAMEARPPCCLVIHAVFAGTAFEDILAAGAGRIVTTDTIPHSSNAIGTGGLIADAIAGIAQAEGSRHGR